MTDKNEIQAQLREKSDPQEQGMPVPMVVLLVIGALFMWGMYYIFSSDLRNSADMGDNRVAVDFKIDESGIVDGGQLYTAHCVACHQATGTGVPGVFPPIAGSEWVVGKPEILAQIMLHGITGEITVMGNTYNGAMPHFDDKLNDAEIAGLMNHLRTNFDNEAETVDAAFVQAQREETADRTTPWNGDADLEAMK
ncbi:cytochrome c [Paenalcaligenes niemegkensis]|uniref:c-type cytochrome n=1 Tax=Paenalcaligenes niemegkensis TaxID=2895469 RepID=UPI001EE7A96B|nr:cytochrome c [Paenalcaligenes niemegkensis]MCQ9617261.1 cytochrome c [Paenalcaligenes niemegkensis]